VSRAYNAFGLIGTECNGIAVIDDQEKRIMLDQVCKVSSGYLCPTATQVKRLKELKELSVEEFTEWMEEQPRLRGM